VHAFVDVEQILFSAELIVDVDAFEVAFTPGPNCFEAEMRGPVQDERLLSLFSEVRKLEQPWLIPFGMSGLALGVEAEAELADDDCA